MKITIRNNVWETNSSSIHSISIPKKKLNIDESHISFKIEIPFKTKSFGWEVRSYNDIDSKASYLYTAIINLYSDSSVEKSVSSASRKKIEDAKNWIFNILDKYGFKAVFYPPTLDNDGWFDDYIDHPKDLKNFVEAVTKNENRLMNYLFGDGVIVTYNDNMDYPDEAYSFKNRFKQKDYEIYEKWN